MLPKPQLDKDKLYYSIGEVAEMFDVNASLIRFWEKEFELLKPRKNKKGNRLYTHKDIETFHLIYHLVKEKGFTLQGAKEKLLLPEAEIDKNIEILQTLKELRAFLTEVKNHIQQVD